MSNGIELEIIHRTHHIRVTKIVTFIKKMIFNLKSTIKFYFTEIGNLTVSYSSPSNILICSLKVVFLLFLREICNDDILFILNTLVNYFCSVKSE